MRLYLFPAMFFAMLLCPVFAVAQSATDAAISAARGAFSDLERQVIRAYYNEHIATEPDTDQPGEAVEDSDDDANGKGKFKKHKKSKGKGKGNKQAAREKGKRTPPGVADKGGLPPGIRKKLDRGGDSHPASPSDSYRMISNRSCRLRPRGTGVLKLTAGYYSSMRPGA